MPSRTLRNYATFARLLLPAALALLASCAASEHSAFITVTTQPANVGDSGIAARAYHDSGSYDRDLAIVANQAARWITERAANARRPALVLDIDETALSNWEIIKLDDSVDRSKAHATPVRAHRAAGPPGISLDAIRQSRPRCRYSALHALAMSPYSSSLVVRNRSAQRRSAICATRVSETTHVSSWCQTLRITLPPPISRHQYASRSNAWATPSSPIWAISPPTCAAVTPKRNFFCPTHSTAYPETLCCLLFLLNPDYVLRSVPEAGRRNV